MACENCESIANVKPFKYDREDEYPEIELCVGCRIAALAAYDPGQAVEYLAARASMMADRAYDREMSAWPE